MGVLIKWFCLGSLFFINWYIVDDVCGLIVDELMKSWGCGWGGRFVMFFSNVLYVDWICCGLGR